MTRMRWLDSTIGIDDTVPAPFVPVTHEMLANGSLVITAVNKHVSVHPNGLPDAITVQRVVMRSGKRSTQGYQILAAPVMIELLDESGLILPQQVGLFSCPPTAAKSADQSSPVYFPVFNFVPRFPPLCSMSSPLPLCCS